MIKYTNKQILKNGDNIIYCKFFPKKVYINAFKPYLYNYLMFKNNNDQTISFDCWTKFKTKICRFHRKSPLFGRQIMRINNKKNTYNYFNNLPNTKKYYDYYTTHINYYNNEITKYDHIRPTPLNKRNFYNDNDNIYSSDSDDDISNTIPSTPTDSDDDGDGINIIINSNYIINQSENDNNIEVIHQDC